MGGVNKGYAAWGATSAVFPNVPAGGTYYWDVPDGVKQIDVFVCGGGGAGGSPNTTGMPVSRGGGGGFTATYKRRDNYDGLSNYAKQGDAIPVAPGETLTIVVGNGGAPVSGSTGGSGSASSVRRGSTVLMAVNGGAGGLTHGTSGTSTGAAGGSNSGYPTSGTTGTAGGSDGNPGQGFTTRPFAELGGWIKGLVRQDGNFTPDATVPYSGGGGAGIGSGSSQLAGGVYGGGRGGANAAIYSANDGVDSYGGGGGGGNHSSSYPHGGRRGGVGCVIIRWGF